MNDAQLDAYGNLLGAVLATAGSIMIIAVIAFIIVDTYRIGRKK